MNNEQIDAEYRKKQLYLRQKKMLDEFLERGAISKEQYKKSLGALTEKMGMQSLLNTLN